MALRMFLAALALMAADPHTAAVMEWRQKYEADLRAPYTGWLNVTGLYWLKEGANQAGSADSNDIVLPRGPRSIGSFDFDGRLVRYKGKALRVDTSDDSDTVEIDGMRLIAIERNGKFGLRLREASSSFLKAFPGNEWFPIRSEYKVRGKFIPHPYKRTINFPDVTGHVQKMLSPGVVEFTLRGVTMRLEPVENEGQLFFVFKDKTAGKTTYGAGRMMYAPLPVNGVAEIDFNVAKHPPCSFTPFATCPLPPKQNILPIAIEAGERIFGGAH